MSELVCDREFVGTVNGESLRIFVEWMKPRRDRGDWRCDFVIHRPHLGEARGYAVGVDSTQALLLAMGLASDRLKLEIPDAEWLDTGGLGLPEIPFAR